MLKYVSSSWRLQNSDLRHFKQNTEQGLREEGLLFEGRVRRLPCIGFALHFCTLKVGLTA